MKKGRYLADSEYLGLQFHLLPLAPCDFLFKNSETINSHDNIDRSDFEEVEEGTGLEFVFEDSLDKRNFENGKIALAVEHVRKYVETC